MKTANLRAAPGNKANSEMKNFVSGESGAGGGLGWPR